MESNYQLMVDLDSIIDPRLAVVSLLDPQFSCALVENNYKKRTTDWFIENGGNYTKEQYLQRYKARDGEVLNCSTMTPIVEYINEMIASQIKEQTTALADQSYCIFLNISPYDLDEESKQDLAKCVNAYIPLATEIKIVNIDTQWLTPGYFASNRITAYITYHAKEWLQTFAMELEKTPLPSWFLVGPELLDADVNVEELDEEEKEVYNKVGPFRAFEMSAMPYVSLRLIPPGFFSSVFTA